MAVKNMKKPRKLGNAGLKKKKLLGKKRQSRIEFVREPTLGEDEPSFTSSMKHSASPSSSNKKYKKRVSWSSKIDAQSPEPSGSYKKKVAPTPDAQPSKGILRVRIPSTGSKSNENGAPPLKKTKIAPKKIDFDSMTMETDHAEETDQPDATEETQKPKKFDGFKKRPKIVVKKSVKEQLLNMDRKQRRAFLRELREKTRPNFHLALECKQSWEKLRSAKTSDAVKEECIQKIMSIIKGKLRELIYAHDTTRVVQCLLILKRDDIRDELFSELLPEIVRMTKSKYARFFVKKMLKYGTRDQKDTIINAFQGHCVKIYRIIWAAEVLEDAYNNHANAHQRLNILSEFYGKEYVLYKQSQPSINLHEIIEKDPAKKASIALNLHEALEAAVEKTTLKLSLTHKLLADFFSVCSNEQRDTMIESLKDKVPEMCITREGSRVGLLCVWNSSAAERKAIVKSFKGTVLNAAKHEFAHRVLIGIFDSVDDTKLVNKYILSELYNNIADIMYEKYGQKVLHYLVNPRDPRYFFKGEQEMYSQGDANEHSKKPKDVRYKELYEYVAEALYTYIAANMKQLVMTKLTSMLVLNSLEPYMPLMHFHREVNQDYRRSCYQALAEVVSEEFIPHNIEGEKHIIEVGCGRFVLNNLLRADKKLEIKLSDYLADLPKEHLASFVAINNGCFVLKYMFESGSVKAQRVVKSCVSIKALEKSTFVGAKWLLEKLTKISVANVKKDGVKKEH